MKMPNGDVSELTYTDSAARRIITMNESHHSLTTESDRGGSRSVSYGDDNDNRQGRRGTRGSRHISGPSSICCSASFSALYPTLSMREAFIG